jgi:DNA-binding CsgD family transcriptional regulator
VKAGHDPLTEREADVLRAAAQGGTTADIGRALFLSPATVRNYLSNAISKRDARNRIDAIRIAQQSGWISGRVGAGARVWTRLTSGSFAGHEHPRPERARRTPCPGRPADFDDAWRDLSHPSAWSCERALRIPSATQPAAGARDIQALPARRASPVCLDGLAGAPHNERPCPDGVR